VSRSYTLSFSAVALVLLGACGKNGGLANVPPSPGLYHLEDSPTTLDLRSGGTFTVRREVANSIGDLDSGAWSQDTLTPSGHITLRDGLYWPTPSRFPSTVFTKITLHGEEHGDLVVFGESPWAGTFTQHWIRSGR
jgi:hypothetical protein